jgi:hypothetical protein
MSYDIYLSESQCRRTREQREKMSMISYDSIIGFIMYIMLCIRPNMSYALSMTSSYQKDLKEDH